MSAHKSIPITLFPLGHIVATLNALVQLTQEDVLSALRRHQAGDWGDVDALARNVNNHALTRGKPLFSVYHSASGAKFWVITQADRNATTLLLPEDY
jgi:hypothetical protein